jgi:hypothetical protein
MKIVSRSRQLNCGSKRHCARWDTRAGSEGARKIYAYCKDMLRLGDLLRWRERRKSTLTEADSQTRGLVSLAAAGGETETGPRSWQGACSEDGLGQTMCRCLLGGLVEGFLTSRSKSAAICSWAKHFRQPRHTAGGTRKAGRRDRRW